jgi:AraC-like DNA-binding protein
MLVRLCQARELLRDVHGHPRSVRQVARATGLSSFHFIRLYKAVFGETPNQCQIRARLARARQLLALSDLPVTEICMEVGYSSLGTFSEIFTRKVGMSPSAFRRKYRPMALRAGGLPEPLRPGCLSLMSARSEKRSTRRAN